MSTVADPLGMLRPLREEDVHELTREHDSHGTMPLAYDVYRDGQELVIEFDAPGVAPGDIGLVVEGRTVDVSLGRTLAHGRGIDVIEAGRQHGTFRQRLWLGDRWDTDQLTARAENGVLTVRAPLAARARLGAPSPWRRAPRSSMRRRRPTSLWLRPTPTKRSTPRRDAVRPCDTARQAHGDKARRPAGGLCFRRGAGADRGDHRLARAQSGQGDRAVLGRARQAGRPQPGDDLPYRERAGVAEPCHHVPLGRGARGAHHLALPGPRRRTRRALHASRCRSGAGTARHEERPPLPAARDRCAARPSGWSRCW